MEEPGIFHCPGLFAEGGHILRPVIDLIILLVTAPEGTNSMVVVEKFNVVKEDFGLYHLAGQCRGQSVPVRVNHHKTGLAHSQRRIAEYGEGIIRQIQQRIRICLPQFQDRNLVDVVVTLGIFFAPAPQVFLIKLFKGSNGGNRHKGISAAVSNLVLHIALLVARGRVTELGLETVVQHKTAKTLCERSLSASQDLCNSGGHVIETKPGRYTAYVLEDALHPFQQALLVLRGECLRIPHVRVREGDGQGVALLLLPSGVIIQELPEIHLSASWCAFQRKKPCTLDFHHILLLADISLHAGVAAPKAVLVP